MATKVVKRTNKKSADDFNTFNGWAIYEMVLDESEYAVVYVSRSDLEGETRVRNKRTDRSEVFANEEYAMQAFKTLNIAEQERVMKSNRETQEQKERAGYGDW